METIEANLAPCGKVKQVELCGEWDERELHHGVRDMMVEVDGKELPTTPKAYTSWDLETHVEIR